jgi:molybdate transport system substrate-binding protein
MNSMQTMHNFMPGLSPALGRQAQHPSRRRALFGTVVVGLVGGPQALMAQAKPVVRVLAASDVKFALAQQIEQYSRATGDLIQPVFGSSGNLTRQIQQGLSADIFFSADEALVLRLAESGHAQNQGFVYGLGRLALLARRGAGYPLDTRLAGLGHVLGQAQASGQNFKLAMANPEHAPYGRAARETLQASGLWERAQAHLVLGDSVAQATQFVTSGAASMALGAHALVLAPELANTTEHVLVDAALHKPLRQRAVLLRGASAQAQQFFAYLQSPAAQALWARWGFGGAS